MIYPPRPKGRILPTELSSYENKRSWVVQRKFNGTNLMINIKDGEIKLFNKEGQKPKQFTLTNQLKNEFFSLDIDPTKEYWLNGELLDAKTVTPSYKGKIILYEILQAGSYFFASLNFTQRYEILKKICRDPNTLEPNLGIALQATPNIWLAETFAEDFVDRYNDFLNYPEIEGCVLKKGDSTIDSFGKQPYEVGWLIRCRKPSKNYAF